MAANAVVNDKTKPGATTPQRLFSWQTILFCVVALALLLLGIWMRLHDLGLPFDRDGYDEGVYWQSLRAMSEGHALYQQIFYSQPPFFLLSIFPTYMLAGQTLWSARLGVALVSLLGLVGAFLLGKALSGRIGAIAALLLLVVDPLYLAQSQTIQAEAPSAALSLLAVAMAYLWWEKPDGIAGICYAALAGITLSLSILCKFLAFATLVPIGLLMLAQIWRIIRQPAESKQTRLASSRSLLIGIAAFILTTVVVVLPFFGSFHEMWQGVVSFHTAANPLFKSTQASNFALMQHVLISISSAAALYGTIVALLRRDWRVLPLLAWLVATIVLLWMQTPLFHHHLVVLIPPLIALAVMGIGPIQPNKTTAQLLINLGTTISVIIILAVAMLNGQGSQAYFLSKRQTAASDFTKQSIQAAQDLRNATQPGQLVVTDAQFLAALADRSTPPSLVDTSIVRIDTNYVTLQQLIQEASQPRVHAVLFYTGRLNIKSVAAFHTWVVQHFHLARSYGNGRELWVR
jgi:4-amino-4-deoxy-L-arabinose transferase-like glycosyltransferase